MLFDGLVIYIFSLLHLIFCFQNSVCFQNFTFLISKVLAENNVFSNCFLLRIFGATDRQRLPLHAVAKCGTDYFLLKIKNFAERKSELSAKLAIARNGCYTAFNPRQHLSVFRFSILRRILFPKVLKLLYYILLYILLEQEYSQNRNI